MENKKKRINIIDVLILIGIVFFVISIVIWLFNNSTVDEENGKTAKIQYVIMSEQIKEDMADNISVGDKIFDFNSGHEIGVVKSCDVRNAIYTGTSEEGKEVISEVPGYCTLYITVDSVASYSNGSYEVSGTVISAGCDYQLMFPDLYCNGSCVGVEIIG